VLFLTFLIAGIVTAVIIGTRFIPDLLDRYPAQMKGLFLGLVAASVIIPYRHMKADAGRRPTHALHLGLTAVFAAVTYVVVGLPMNHSGNAEGAVVLSFSQPTAAPLRLTVQDTLFMTASHGGDNEKREVVFGPAADVEIAAGSTSATIPVRARMRGEVGNLAPGSVVIARADGLPPGTAVTNPAPTRGWLHPPLW
jgi:hypothetical protein